MEKIITVAIISVLTFVIGFVIGKIILTTREKFKLRDERNPEEQNPEGQNPEGQNPFSYPQYRIMVQESNDGDKTYSPQWLRNGSWESFLYEYNRLEDAQKCIENDKVFVKKSWDKTIASVSYIDVE